MGHIELAKFTSRQDAEARGSRSLSLVEESKEGLETNEKLGCDVKQKKPMNFSRVKVTTE